MKHKGKEEFLSIELQLERRPSTLVLQQHSTLIISSSLRFIISLLLLHDQSESSIQSRHKYRLSSCNHYLQQQIVMYSCRIHIWSIDKQHKSIRNHKDIYSDFFYSRNWRAEGWKWPLNRNIFIYYAVQGTGSFIVVGISSWGICKPMFSNKADYGKGRQMPIHYGSNKHNYFTVASTVA